MKCGAENNAFERDDSDIELISNKLSHLSIEDLPDEILSQIFPILEFNFSELKGLRLVNKNWKALLDNACKTIVHKYFNYLLPRLSAEQLDNPLQLIHNEYTFYTTFFPTTIGMPIVLDVLLGNSAQIATLVNGEHKIWLYGLLKVNCHALPQLPSDNIFDDPNIPNFMKAQLHIPSHAYCIAAALGKIDFLENYQDKLYVGFWSSALSAAAKRNYQDVVEFLLQSLGEKYVFNKDEVEQAVETALCLASKHGHSNLVKILNNHIFDITDLSSRARALSQALSKGHLQIAKYLYNSIDDLMSFASTPNKQLSDTEYGYLLAEGYIDAAANGHEHIIEYELANHTYNRDTIEKAMIEAQKEGRIEIIKKLESHLKNFNDNVLDLPQRQFLNAYPTRMQENTPSSSSEVEPSNPTTKRHKHI